MNLLKVSQQETIISLWKRGWSARRIAREMGYDRDTAANISGWRRRQNPPPRPPALPREGDGSRVEPATLTLGSGEAGEPKQATPSAGKEAGPVTTALEAVQANVRLCEAWRRRSRPDWSRAVGQAIDEDLVRDHGFPGSYQSVKRFVRRLKKEASVPFRRMQFAAGEQMQVDFGTGPLIIGRGRQRRRSHVFRRSCAARARAIARRPSTKRRRRSFAAWRTPTDTLAGCRSRPCRTT